jgi:hypothetical protein
MDIRNRWDLSRLTSPVLMGLTRSLASGFDALADLAEGAARALGAESAPPPSPVPGGPVAVRSGTEEQPARSENRGCITVDGSALNVLVALNDITGAQSSLVIGNSKNVSVVLNRGVSVEVNDNNNLYVVDNSLGGRITAKNNNYKYFN